MDLFAVLYKLFSYLRSGEVEISSAGVLEDVKVNEILSKMEELELDKTMHNLGYENVDRDKINQARGLMLNLSQILNAVEESGEGKIFHSVNINVNHGANSDECRAVVNYIMNYGNAK